MGQTNLFLSFACKDNWNECPAALRKSWHVCQPLPFHLHFATQRQDAGPRNAAMD